MSTYSPNFATQDTFSPDNYVLKFFVTVVIIYTIGSLQYVVKQLLKQIFPLKHEEFTDLCSICNISVLMFDNSFHGYYIHGRSPYGQSDVGLDILTKSLLYEEGGKAQQRGLILDEPDL
jgi:meckelin